jgi:hypothetical protein
MKNLNQFLNEKLVLNKSLNKKQIKIPKSLYKDDLNALTNYYTLIKYKAQKEGIKSDDDYSKLVNFLDKTMPDKYKTPEMIWAFIGCSGWDYFVDEEDDDYLSSDWMDTDPLEEFVYRALEEL